MTSYTAPPDKENLVLERGDVLHVHNGGTATGTTIDLLGRAVVVDGGTTVDTLIKGLGVEDVGSGGVADDTTIKRGGVENVAFGGTADHTIIDGGVENVAFGGTADHTIIDGGTLNVRGVGNDTIINDGAEWVHGASNGTIVNRFGVQYVHGGVANNTTINGGVEEVGPGGVADNVIFEGSRSRLDLRYPTSLKGTITDWSVGDVIHFSNKTHITSVHENAADTTVTVNYFDPDDGNRTVTYSLAGQQANTKIEIRHDAHGGGDLVLVPVTGVQAHHHHEIA